MVSNLNKDNIEVNSVKGKEKAKEKWYGPTGASSKDNGKTTNDFKEEWLWQTVAFTSVTFKTTSSTVTTSNCWCQTWSFTKEHSSRVRLSPSECFSISTEESTTVNKVSLQNLGLASSLIFQVVSKKEHGSKINSMERIVAYLITRLEISTRDLWKKENETAGEDSMTLSATKFTTEILKWTNVKAREWFIEGMARFWKVNSETTLWRAHLNMFAKLDLLKFKKCLTTQKEAVGYISLWTKKLKKKFSLFWGRQHKIKPEWILQTKAIWDKVCTLTRKRIEALFNKMIDLDWILSD